MTRLMPQSFTRTAFRFRRVVVMSMHQISALMTPVNLVAGIGWTEHWMNTLNDIYDLDEEDRFARGETFKAE
jgi:hypothetical protein